MASGTGLLDHATREWDPELLGICGIDAARLPPIDDGPASGLVAPYARRWPALAGARWFPAWGDGACSSVGSDCVGLDRIALNVGTSAALRLITPSVPVTPPGLWRYRVNATRSVVGGATSEGGNVIAWCRDSLALPPDDELEQAVAAVGPDGHGLTVLPFLAGERSPGWRDDARGHIGGLALGSTPAQIVRALMESVAYRLAMIYERLGPLAAPGHHVVASGGALHHSPLWAGILADVLGVPLTMFPGAEASSRGAALLALAGVGTSVPVAPLTGERVEADPERHLVYRSALERHRRLYETVVGSALS
jgi:gluconokinase